MTRRTNYGGKIDRRSMVSVKPHNRNWPLMRKPARVHVAGHRRGWPITETPTITIRRSSAIPKISPKKTSAELRDEVRETAENQPWEVSLQTYLAIKGAPTGGIMLDCSPTQYARMSKAAKRRYDAKRKQESDTRAYYRKEWESKIIDAYEKGVISYDDVKNTKSSGMNDYSASNVIYNYEKEKQEAKERKTETTLTNYRKIRRIDELKPGDVIRHPFGRTVKVKKINNKSVIIEDKFGDGKIEKEAFDRGSVRWTDEKSIKEIGKRRHISERATDEHSAERLKSMYMAQYGKDCEIVKDPEGYFWVTEKNTP